MQKYLQKASLTSRNQELHFQDKRQNSQKQDQDSMKIDINGQVSKKFEVSKVSNTNRTECSK